VTIKVRDEFLEHFTPFHVSKNQAALKEKIEILLPSLLPSS
jgi:hypothetical protein